MAAMSLPLFFSFRSLTALSMEALSFASTLSPSSFSVFSV